MLNRLEILAKRIPPNVAKIIVEEGFISKAVNSDVRDTPMEYLFDVYEEFLDTAGEYDDWTCFKCREHALEDFKKLEPLLIQMYAAK
jgi:hypothetical protein